MLEESGALLQRFFGSLSYEIHQFRLFLAELLLSHAGSTIVLTRRRAARSARSLNNRPRREKRIVSFLLRPRDAPAPPAPEGSKTKLGSYSSPSRALTTIWTSYGECSRALIWPLVEEACRVARGCPRGRLSRRMERGSECKRGRD